MGDPKGNIQGMPEEVGKPGEILLIGTTMFVPLMYKAVETAYEKHYGDIYYNYLLENANLLWIQREKGVLWTPPG